MKVSETFYLTIILFIQDFTILSGAILFLITPQPGKQPYLELGIMLILSVLTEIASWTGVFAYHANMNLSPNIFSIVQLLLAILFYRRQVTWLHKNIVAACLLCAFLIFSLINLFFIQGPHTINSYTLSFSSFCLIIISMTYHFGYALQLPIESREKLPMYWINIATLLYHSTIFLMHFWIDYLVSVKQSNLITFWMIHAFLGIIYYSTLVYALTLIRKQHLPKLSPD